MRRSRTFGTALALFALIVAPVVAARGQLRGDVADASTSSKVTTAEQRAACVAAVLQSVKSAASSNGTVDQHTMDPQVAELCLDDFSSGGTVLTRGKASHGFLDMVTVLLAERASFGFEDSDGTVRCPTTVTLPSSYPTEDDDEEQVAVEDVVDHVSGDAAAVTGVRVEVITRKMPGREPETVAATGAVGSVEEEVEEKEEEEKKEEVKEEEEKKEEVKEDDSAKDDSAKDDSAKDDSAKDDSAKDEKEAASDNTQGNKADDDVISATGSTQPDTKTPVPPTPETSAQATGPTAVAPAVPSPAVTGPTGAVSPLAPAVPTSPAATAPASTGLNGEAFTPLPMAPPLELGESTGAHGYVDAPTGNHGVASSSDEAEAEAGNAVEEAAKAGAAEAAKAKEEAVEAAAGEAAGDGAAEEDEQLKRLGAQTGPTGSATGAAKPTPAEPTGAATGVVEEALLDGILGSTDEEEMEKAELDGMMEAQREAEEARERLAAGGKTGGATGGVAEAQEVGKTVEDLLDEVDEEMSNVEEMREENERIQAEAKAKEEAEQAATERREEETSKKRKLEEQTKAREALKDNNGFEIADDFPHVDNHAGGPVIKPVEKSEPEPKATGATGVAQLPPVATGPAEAVVEVPAVAAPTGGEEAFVGACWHGCHNKYFDSDEPGQFHGCMWKCMHPHAEKWSAPVRTCLTRCEDNDTYDAYAPCMWTCIHDESEEDGDVMLAVQG